MTAPRVEGLISTAARYGLAIDPAEVVTDGLPAGWAIVPRHWGFNLYDCTVLAPCGLGWSGGEMQRKRKAIKAARREVVSHLAECNRCTRTIEGTAVAS